MTISKEQRCYGQLLVDFANATSTDEAGLKYFENIQKAFDLPYSFIDEAKNIFPTLNDFYSALTKEEIKCLELISQKKMIENEIAACLYVNSLRYDAYSKTVHIEVHQEMQLEDGSIVTDTSIERICRDLSIDELEEMIRQNDSQPDSTERKENIFSSSIPTLLRLGNRITKIEGISNEKYQELYLLEDTCANIEAEHDYIEVNQKKMKSFFKDVMKNRAPINTQLLNKTSLDDVYFTDRSDFPFPFLYRVYKFPLVYCIAEFFNVTNNIEHLKKCELCKKFYIANKQIKEQKRCSTCSKKTRLTTEENRQYQRNRRLKQNENKKEENKEIEAKIRELRKAGISQKNAKDFVQKICKPSNSA